MVGLATAWFLQEQGVEVTVLDRGGVAAGSSWGNAGWLTPGISTPLPEPAVLKYGVRALLKPSSPVYVPPTANPRLVSFLARFARHSTMPAWKRAMAALVPINRAGAGELRPVDRRWRARRHPRGQLLPRGLPQRRGDRDLREEIDHIRAAGQEIEYEVLSGDEARTVEPALSREVSAALRCEDSASSTQARSCTPWRRGRGPGREDPRSHHRQPTSAHEGTGVRLATSNGPDELHFDAVVLATGAWLGSLARPFGVKTLVQAGRGYSFSVPVEHVPDGPVYFPTQRVACTPLGDRLRVAGMMEFRSPEADLDPRRIAAIVEAARPLLAGADLDRRQDEWVGSRPCTPDGLPLIGATRSPRVFAAGGHGMWGITLGPATGRPAGRAVATGTVPAELPAQALCADRVAHPPAPSNPSRVNLGRRAGVVHSRSPRIAGRHLEVLAGELGRPDRRHRLVIASTNSVCCSMAVRWRSSL